MCLLWGLIILQTAGVYPETFPSWTPDRVVRLTQRLGTWASHKPMDEICWISFCSLGLAYFVESFVRKLDELANGAVEEMHLGRQMSPYNLVRHEPAPQTLSHADIYSYINQGRTFLCPLPILTLSIPRSQT